MGKLRYFTSKTLFFLLGLKLPLYIEFWQCIGMIVGVYGIGYLVAAKNPVKYWPITLVGLLGKIFGPIGFLQAIVLSDFPLKFGFTLLTNDLIWWPSFGLILYKAYKRKTYGLQISINETEFEQFSTRKRAKFINSLSGFKACSLLATKDSQGTSNLCMVSSAFHLGAHPALVGLIIRPDSVPRDSLNNIRATKFYTLNHVHTKILKAAHQTSARYPSETSEFVSCGFQEEYLQAFFAPFVKEARVKIAVELVREVNITENSTHLLIGKIKAVHLQEGMMSADGHIDLEKAGSLTVSGLDSYHETESLGRLSYAKPDISPYFL